MRISKVIFASWLALTGALLCQSEALAQQPDLIVTNVEAPATAGAGQSITVYWTTSNTGTTGTGGSFIFDGVYLSSDTVFDPETDEYVGAYFHTDSLDAGNSEQDSASVTLPAETIGLYYIIVRTDDISFVAESNEDNNTGLSQVLTISADAPDLQVTGVQAPATAASQQLIQVSYSVINDGTLDITNQSWWDYVFLSDDSVYSDSNDVSLTTVFHDTSLAMGQSYAETVSVYVPPGLSGHYYIIVLANGSESFPESDRTNNAGHSDAIGIDLLRPDLIISTLTVPDTIVTGDKLRFTYQVTNQGDTSTKFQSWSEYISFSSDSAAGDDTLLFSHYHTENLLPGQSITVTDSAFLPAGLTPGRDHIVIESDVLNQVNESNEANNTRISEAFLYGYTGPDLVVASLQAPPEAFSGQNIQVSWTVTNSGTIATSAPQWYDRIYLSPNPVFNPLEATALSAFQNVSYLDTGESYGNTQTVALPEGVAGTYYIYAGADGYGMVAETAEDNNIGRSDSAMQIALSPAPDLTVTSLVVPALAFSRDTISVSYTVTNAGDAGTGTPVWYDNIYLSQDTVLDPLTDHFLAFVQHEGALAADSAYTGSLEVVLPHAISGPYYVFVTTDIYNFVYEYTAESNNRRHSDSMTVTLTPPPDLVVSSIGAPASGNSGQSLALQWTVQNQGFTQAFEGAWYDRVYLSRTPTFIPESLYTVGTFSNPKNPEPDSAYNRSENVLIPEGLSGPFYVWVKTDYNNKVFENVYEDNNVTRSASETQVTLTPWADLHLTTYQAPSEVTAGQQATVSWSVSNSGAGGISVPLWSDRIYLSPSAVWDSLSATLLREAPHVPPLDPPASYSQSATVGIPATVSGTHYFYIFTDAGNTVYEHTDEGNNITRSAAVVIQPYPPVDLAVASVLAPASAASGFPIAVDWIVQNAGAGKTLAGTWDDALYLSQDTVLNPAQDSLLVVVPRTGALEPGETYARSVQATVPNGLSGSYFALVRTDTGGKVEDSDLANNLGSSSIPLSISLTPAPDLATAAVAAPSGATAGQPVMVHWTVTNNGPGPIGAAGWNDAVSISTDEVFDNSDKRLATIERNGPLNSGASYDDSAEVTIPAYVSGNVHLFVESDSRHTVYEQGIEGNNVGSRTIDVALAPPSDLVVMSIAPPETVLAGQEVTISWTIANLGANAATGYLSDAVYISTDTIWQVTDPVFGIDWRQIDLAPGAEMQLSMKGDLLNALLADSTGSAGGPVPGFPPGDYHVIVRTDIRNNIRESDEHNNTAPSASTMRIDVPALPIGTGEPGTIAQGRFLYYRVDVPAGQTLRIGFDGLGLSGSVELFARLGEVPSRTEFDYSYSSPVLPDQTIIVPETESGTYYLLAYGDYLPAGPMSYTILAELKTFSISAVSPEEGGNTGEVTMTVEGARFTAGSRVKLIVAGGAGGAAPRLITNRVIDASRIDATFDMTDSLPLGAYDVVVTRPDSSQAVLAGGFTLVPGTPLSGNLGFNPPSAILRGGTGFYAITVENSSNVDLPFLTAYIVIPAGQGYTVSSGNMQTVTQLLPDTIRSQVTVSDYFDFGFWRFIPLTARSVRVGQQLNIALQVTNVQGDEFPIQIVVDALTRQEFIQAQLLYFEYFRQAVLQDAGGGLSPDFYQLAQTPGAFTDGLLQTYADLGILTEDDISSVTPAAIDAVVKQVQRVRLDPGSLPMAFSPTLTTCQEGVEWANIGFRLGIIGVGLITGTLLAPVTFGLSAVLAVTGALSLGSSIGHLITGEAGLLARIICSDDDPRTPTRVVASKDPNDITGPAGFGERKWVALDQTLLYTIRFENDPKLATAPAQVVTISLDLDSTVDVRTFRLGNFGFGGSVFTDAASRAHYTRRLDVTDSLGLYVDISSGIDIAANRAFWTFRSVNPATGELPSNPLSGFLPVNDSTHHGEGFVTFTVRPEKTSETGDLIHALARIVFDVNDPLDTPPIQNTIDAGRPQSSVRTLAAQSDTASFLVRWGGADDSTGSGIRNFTIFVSTDGGPYNAWLQNVTDTSGIFTGQPGEQYRFYSLASDNAGNVEPGKSSPDATTLLTGVEEPRAGLPGEYRLHQNFPNPFNPVTTLNFDLPAASRVLLTVYNMLGQEIEVMVDEMLEPGYKSVRWDASGKPSGVYFYRLTAGSFTMVRKMLLLR